MGSAGKVIEKSVKKTTRGIGDVLEGTVQFDPKKILKGAGTAVEGSAFAGLKAVVAGVADITGATAAKEGLEAQIAQSQAEARRQALLSDELARSAGGEATKVTLNTRRSRLGINQSATGISGSGSSRGTGVQQ